MFEIACVVDAGIGCHGNDDRAMVCHQVIDSGYYSTTAEQVFAVICDGVGGEAYGYEAAGIAAKHFASLDEQQLTAEQIRQELIAADMLIRQAQQQDAAHAQMASTAAGIWLSGDDFIAFNVGDSRVYRYRPPYIAQLSTDHSLTEEMKALGLEPKPEQVHVITQYLGGACHRPEVVDGHDMAFERDTYLICSDGISDVISDLELEEIMARNLPLKDLCWYLVEHAVEQGSEDNLSVIIVRRS